MKPIPWPRVFSFCRFSFHHCRQVSPVSFKISWRKWIKQPLFQVQSCQHFDQCLVQRDLPDLTYGKTLRQKNDGLKTGVRSRNMGKWKV